MEPGAGKGEKKNPHNTYNLIKTQYNNIAAKRTFKGCNISI